MSMTARQIRDALKPMKDFAPAILAAAEIAEVAEQAEAAMASKAAERDKLDKDIATSRRILDEVTHAVQAKAAQLSSCGQDLSLEQEKMGRALVEATSQHQKKLAGYVAEQAEKESHLAALNQKIDEANATLKKAQDDLREFRRQLKQALPVT